MKPLNAATVQTMALLFHGYSIPDERAQVLADEINLYLGSIERRRHELSFDDAPADFSRYLEDLAAR